MDDLLTSVRRIIADDEDAGDHGAQAGSGDPRHRSAPRAHHDEKAAKDLTPSDTYRLPELLERSIMAAFAGAENDAAENPAQREEAASAGDPDASTRPGSRFREPTAPRTPHRTVGPSADPAHGDCAHPAHAGSAAHGSMAARDRSANTPATPHGEDQGHSAAMASIADALEREFSGRGGRAANAPQRPQDEPAARFSTTWRAHVLAEPGIENEALEDFEEGVPRASSPADTPGHNPGDRWSETPEPMPDRAHAERPAAPVEMPSGARFRAGPRDRPGSHFRHQDTQHAGGPGGSSQPEPARRQVLKTPLDAAAPEDGVAHTVPHESNAQRERATRAPAGGSPDPASARQDALETAASTMPARDADQREEAAARMQANAEEAPFHREKAASVAPDERAGRQAHASPPDERRKEAGNVFRRRAQGSARPDAAFGIGQETSRVETSGHETARWERPLRSVAPGPGASSALSPSSSPSSNSSRSPEATAPSSADGHRAAASGDGLGRSAASPCNDDLTSASTRESVQRAMDQLAATPVSDTPRTLEDLVREMMRPMLREWLEANLSTIVERTVRQEIERVAARR